MIPPSVEADTLAKQAESSSRHQPEAPLEIEQPPQMAVKTPVGAEKLHFILKNIVVGDGSVYSAKQLTDTYRELLGKEVSLADMYAVAARITQRYRDDGYVLAHAFLPPQSIGNGIVHIDIIEGYVACVTWKGDPLDSRVAKTLANQLVASYPFNGNVLESVMLRLNDLPSVTARATMLPYKEADAREGAIEIQLTIVRKRISAQAGIDDYASRYLGVWEDNLQTSVSGILSPVDQLSLNSAYSADPRYSRYVRGEYSIPVNASDTTFKLGSSESNSAPGYRLTDLDIRSDAISYWVGVSQPLIRTRVESLTIRGQFNINNQDTDVLGERFYDDRLRTLQFSGQYSFSDSWAGSNLLDVGMEHGLNILNATETGSALLSRPYGQSDFTKLTFNASRLQELNDKFSLLAASTGQVSNAPLLVSEQFGFGGPVFGRAYDTSEITGDDGIAASLELRYDGLNPWNDVTVQPFTYYDIGKVWNRSPDGATISAASAGGGLRFLFSPRLQAECALAKPLTLTPGAPKLGSDDKDPRIELSIKLLY